MTGALKVRTSISPDVWTTIGGAPKDAIHVGTEPPADPDVELWWDSDAPAAYLPAPVDFSDVTIGELEVDGALDHDGSTVGFYGATPVVKAASPGTAAGPDAAVLNAVITALRNLGLVT